MSEKTERKRVPILVIAIYSLLLYSVWTVYHFFILKHIEAIPNEAVSALLNDGLCKNIVWTLPAVLLIRRYSDKLEISPSKFFSWKKEYFKYLLIFPAFAAYIVFGIIAHKTKFDFSIDIKQIVTVVFVGITEELVFRVWLLNSTIKYAKKPENEDDIPWQEYACIALNAVMFLAIHFPRWLSEGVFIYNITSLGFLSILVLSVVFSLVFLKTKNIVLPITLHMFWDFLIFLLY